MSGKNGKSDNKPRKPIETLNLVKVCAWCSSWSVNGHRWTAPSVFLPDVPQTHGICPECRKRLELQFR